MAGMFYSLKESAEKLKKTQDEVRALAKQGKLREFRDGSNLLFKIDEVEALMSDTSIVSSKKEDTSLEQHVEPAEVIEPKQAPQSRQTAKPKKAKAPEKPAEPQKLAEEDILISPETAVPPAESDLTSEDTALTVEGKSVLGETDLDYQLTDDTMAETTIAPGTTGTAGMMGTTGEASLEEIEENVELDAFGSGSGLLDLSLQADDTSLGGILDEIYTSEGGEEGAKPSEAASAEEMVAEAEPAVGGIPEEELTSPSMIQEAPVIAQPYLEAPPDALSKSLGIMLFLPLLAIIYAAIVTISGMRNVIPAILGSIKTPNLPIYIMGGLLVAAGLVFGVGYMVNGGIATGPKKPKEPKKPKKSKKAPKESPASEEEAAA
jgi:hypothetical protein